MPKIRNIIIFIAIGAVLVLIYIFFIRASPDNTTTLVSSSGASAVSGTGAAGNNPSVAQDFLTLLLSVKNIKLDDTIFSDDAFKSLHDSSITLTPDGNEGRPNPFAPLGTDNVVSPPITTGNPVTPSPGKKTGA